MVRRDDIIALANELLEVDAWPDSGPMGLQVTGSEDVDKIACGVSASRELFERAAETDAQMVIVHHGLFWDKDPRVVGPLLRDRLKALFDADMSLAAYHLALDAHPELGNNAFLARELGVSPKRRFAEVGFGGPLERPRPIADVTARVELVVGRPPLIFSYGPERVERVAICSGGAARYVADAVEEGYDCFLTGEADEPTKHAAKEARIHFIAAGHYATETSGVQALSARLSDELGLAWEFIDLPNPV
jgi:dinuclear metal center YbgI/SA1388 family protein